MPARRLQGFPPSYVKRGEIYIHPEDTYPYPDEVVSDRAAFVPSPNEVGVYTNWGLPAVQLNVMQGYMAAVNRDNLYLDVQGGRYATPYEQFIEHLALRKERLVKSPEIQTAMNAMLVIRVALEECEEDCWRLIQVPASTSLAVLHDQILGPAMGWSRGYHGYVFLDPRDGAIMGPKKNDGYLDMMHVNIAFNGFMDDRKCPLALVLREVGDKCSYKYDLGDGWNHTLTVEQVLPPHTVNSEDPLDIGGVELLDGRGDCPPEDSNGLVDKGCYSYSKFLDKYKAHPGSCKTAIKEASQSVNFKTRPVPYDPLRFNIGYHRALLTSVLLGPRVAVKDFHEFKERYTECFACQDRLEPMSKCAKCKTATYCCRACQEQDWPKHKLVCASYAAKV